MKITIDTKEDSHQEIRKIIRMLSSLVEEKEVFSNQKDVFSEDNESTQSGGVQSENSQGGIFNMFDSSPKSEESKEEEKKESDDSDLGDIGMEEYD